MGGTGSGRIPKPAGLLLLEGRGAGRDSGGRRVRQLTGIPREAPEPPGDLDGAALAVWERLVPDMDRAHILTPLHQDVVALYCKLVADEAELCAVIKAEGRFIFNPQTGHQHPHPAVAMLVRTRELMLKHERELGLTPSSESRVANVPIDDEGDNPFAGPS